MFQGWPFSLIEKYCGVRPLTAWLGYSLKPKYGVGGQTCTFQLEAVHNDSCPGVRFRRNGRYRSVRPVAAVFMPRPCPTAVQRKKRNRTRLQMLARKPN